MHAGYFSIDNVSNPLMWNWNAVELRCVGGRAGGRAGGRGWNAVARRYCDGASLSGDKPTPTVFDNVTLHFRGALNILVIVTHYHCDILVIVTYLIVTH